MGYFNPWAPPDSFSLFFFFLKKQKKKLAFQSAFCFQKLKNKTKQIPQTITVFVGKLSFFVFIQVLIYKSSKDTLVDSWNLH